MVLSLGSDPGALQIDRDVFDVHGVPAIGQSIPWNEALRSHCAERAHRAVDRDGPDLCAVLQDGHTCGGCACQLGKAKRVREVWREVSGPREQVRRVLRQELLGAYTDADIGDGEARWNVVQVVEVVSRGHSS